MMAMQLRLGIFLASVAIAAGGYLAFAVWAGWRDVTGAIAAAGAGPLVVVGSLSLVNYFLRFIRWEVYLRWQGYRLPFWQSLRIYIAGFALTTTPGKLGETIRTPLLSQYGVKANASLAAFLAERLSDLFGVLLLALAAAAAWSAYRLPLAIAAVALGLLTISFGPVARVVSRRATSPRVPGSRLGMSVEHVADLLRTLTSCLSAFPLGLGMVLGVLAWFAEAYAFAYLLGAMGHDVGIEAATFVYCFSLLVGAISFLPGGLGSSEATMAGLLVYLGLPAPAAAAGTVLIRVLTLWFAVLLGLVALSSRTLAPPADRPS